MSSVNERVRLSSPIHFESKEHAFIGVITDIAPLELVVQAQTKASHSNLPEATYITVKFSPETEFHIHCNICSTDSDSQWTMVPVSDTDRKLIHDLLAKVRKDQHIEICHKSDVESSDRFTGFDKISFVPEALPELSFDELDTKVQFLNHQFDFPILITGMTGGVEKGTLINRRLAAAAEYWNIPMGIGSQRMALDNPEFAPIFDVKKTAPNVFLIGNLGMAQLMEEDYLSRCQKAVEMIDANALAIHLNVIQESIQVEGDRNFKGILNRLEVISKKLDVPVIIKEVGSGIAVSTAIRLKEAGVAAIDVGGRGGTSWGYIEGLRSASQNTRILGETFRNWGIPTAYNIAAIREHLETLPLIATGGIRDGLTVAKAVALGADLVGIGLPLLRAALEEEDGPQKVLEGFTRALKITMIGTGSKSLTDLEHHISQGIPLQENFDSYLFGKNAY